MSIATNFSDFLSAIRPTAGQIANAKRRHTELRERLLGDKQLASIIVTTFLQGSYKRATILRPVGKEKMDVDLVVVTTIDDRLPPSYAFQQFTPFVKNHYPGQWELQGRSIGIKLDDIELDLVITARPQDEVLMAMANEDLMFAEHNNLLRSFPSTMRRLAAEDETVEELFEATRRAVTPLQFSEARESLANDAQKGLDDWQDKPLRIPDRDTREWQDTHPLAQIEWTSKKNAETNGHFVNIVKAIKWWRQFTPNLPKYPKSYPLEHMIGQCCPADVTVFADGLRDTLAKIAEEYRRHANAGTVPFLPDHGCPNTNVLARVDADDFQVFHRGVDAARIAASKASEVQDEAIAAKHWQQLLGPTFPAIGASGGFTPRTQQSEPSEGRFA